MSGGSYDYAYQGTDEMARSLRVGNSALRRAFRAHLRKVAKAMHDIEWVDSGDCGPGDEMAAIRDCLGLTADVNVGRIDAALLALETAIDEEFGPSAEKRP